MPKKSEYLRDMIYWQYANLIAKSAGMEKNYPFIIKKLNQLKKGEITWSTTIREYRLEFINPNSCIYCGKEEDLQIEHMIPRSKGGKDHPDNLVRVCSTCNQSKSNKGLYEYFGYHNRAKVPRIAEGKYLKLLYDELEIRGLLMTHQRDIELLCQRCTLQQKCPVLKELNIYCLEGVL